VCVEREPWHIPPILVNDSEINDEERCANYETARIPQAGVIVHLQHFGRCESGNTVINVFALMPAYWFVLIFAPLFSGKGACRQSLAFTPIAILLNTSC
jgi:hypothetical protein